MDKLVRNSGRTPAASTPRNHAFPTLSTPKDRIVGELDDGGAFQRIHFGPDGGRQGRGGAFADAPESQEEQQRIAVKRAYDDGFTDGKSAGAAEARKEMASVMSQFHRAYIDLEKFRKEIYLNAEAVAVELAMAIARKVVHHEVSVNANIVVAVIREALTRIVDQERVRIHVNPSDMPAVTGALDEFAGVVKRIENVTFEPDASVSPGGCQINTNFGDVDAGIDTQLAMIEERLGAEFDTARVRG